MHVGRRLHTSLELERCHARPGKRGHVVDGAVVVRAEGALALGRLQAHALATHEVEGQPARLGAEPAVGRAPLAQKAREHAQPRVAGAYCPMCKDLQLAGSNAQAGRAAGLLGRDTRDLCERELAREGHARRAQLGAERDAAGVMHVSLGGDVHLGRRQLAPYQREEPPVLDDEGVGTRGHVARGRLDGTRELGLLDHDVGRHVDARAVRVRQRAEPRELVLADAGRATARVEPACDAAVDGIGPGGQRRQERLPVARGGQQLGHVSSRRHGLSLRQDPLRAHVSRSRRTRSLSTPSLMNT